MNLITTTMHFSWREYFVYIIAVQILSASLLLGQFSSHDDTYKYAGFLSIGKTAYFNSKGISNVLSLATSQGIVSFAPINAGILHFSKRIWMFGYTHDFTEPQGTNSIVFDLRLGDAGFTFFYNLGYSFGYELTKGFTLITGIGQSLGIASTPDLCIEGGGGIKGGQVLVFVRIGLVIQ